MSTEDTPKPVAWQARGYSQFRTGNPGPWRFFEGPTKPALNKPEECDIEPLFSQATIDAAVAKERERCAMAVVDYSLSYPFDENDRSLFDECAQYVRDGVLPSA